VNRISESPPSASSRPTLSSSSGESGRPDAHTKIVATIGPASEDRVEELIAAGLSVARLNFSHGDAAEHRERVRRIREASAKLDVPIAVLGDIQGPKMRLGRFIGGKLRVAPGDRFRLREGSGEADRGEILVDVDGFADAIAPGHRLYLADGVVEMVIEARGKDSWIGAVRRGGNLGDKKGVHLPDSALSVELPTEKDIHDLELVRELGVDILGVSFVGSADDIRRIRTLAPGIPIVAKIERLAALEEIQGILEEADGIMVARGDLGVEVELERLPMVQKTLIRKAREAGVFSITATEMLESMVNSSRPTRAEVADVANAILDGTDAVMLSAETAVGLHPVAAVQVMSKVANSVEHSEQYLSLPKVTFRDAEPTFSNAIALAAVRVAEALGLEKIICFTESGNTVRQISRYRPSAEILALTPNENVLRQMAVLAHVRPLLVPRARTLDEMLFEACDFLTRRSLAVHGEDVVFVAGVPPGKSRSTNVIKLHRVGDDAHL
jgi:pyruvate kinase